MARLQRLNKSGATTSLYKHGPFLNMIKSIEVSTLHDKLDLHQIYLAQIWCKKVQTKVK